MPGIAILGAGLQGVSVALELASRGVAVDLIDQDARILNRASLRNEGKVHLGFVYAMDPTLATARAMLRGALSFGPLMMRWTDGGFAQVQQSRPFTYLVPPDSLLSMEALAGFYSTLQSLYAAARPASYLGAEPHVLWAHAPHADYAPFIRRDAVLGGFSTIESALDLQSMTALLERRVVAEPGITLRTGLRVDDIERAGTGFRVRGENADGKAWQAGYDQVVNALWDGRLAIDGQLGLRPVRTWVYRLKYRVLVDLPPHLQGMPSMTFVLGPYGDVVTYPDGPTYVSWYPECMRGWSTGTLPPAEWARACRGEVSADERQAIGRQALRAFDALVPGIAQSRILTVDAGVIFAWGERDIGEVESELHQRDDIGVQSVDGYHSINTGKLTTAPLFAMTAADRVCARAGRAG